MAKNTIKKPFSIPFLADFVLAENILPLTDKDIFELDNELSRHEQLFLDPDVEKNLISKNELLASFGISKAEQSKLTLKEAEDVYKLITEDPEYDFIGRKIKSAKKLGVHDYDKLEFFNVVKTFREINKKPLSDIELSEDLIKNIHISLTRGMDIFKNHLRDFTAYRSGEWRKKDDSIRVGDYIPMTCKDIKTGVAELISWFNNNTSIVSVAIFHTTLYAIHPFNNGNKRVCRILEHILLRKLGLNEKNLYSTSYYYHKEKARYYKHLLSSLERKNLNYFVSFILEALALSIISVMKTTLEIRRNVFLSKQQLDDPIKATIKPLIKRHELQFKHLYKMSRRRIAKQTFVTYLGKAFDAGAIAKRESGRSTFYSLNIKTSEKEVFDRWLAKINKQLPYIPDDIRLV